jgi:hypothetical protein
MALNSKVNIKSTNNKRKNRSVKIWKITNVEDIEQLEPSYNG